MNSQLKARLKFFFTLKNWTPPIYHIIMRDVNKKLGKLKDADMNWRSRAINHGLIQKIFKDAVVLNGPFKGLKYTDMSVGSALYPKLLGCYEMELHNIIGELINKNFDTVIDIGCAEGYYAIGFAMKSHNTKVLAFDTEPKAKELCSAMAEINGVGDRVKLGDFCTPETLLNIDLKNALVFADCEGYEKTLFLDEQLYSHLTNTHILVELHDFMDYTISLEIFEKYKHSHDIISIRSTDDIYKAQKYNYKELDGVDITTKYTIVREYRPCIMEWFYMTPKKQLPPY